MKVEIYLITYSNLFCIILGEWNETLDIYFIFAKLTDPGSVHLLGVGSPVISQADHGNLGNKFVMLY